MAKKMTDEEYIQKMRYKCPTIKVDQIPQKSDDMGLFTCLICGGQFSRTREYSLDGHGCPICSGYIIVKGINDFATKYPDLVKYFVNPEEAYIHTAWSHDKVLLKCPDCGSTKYMFISDLARKGFNCSTCGDGISFPNKLSYAILEQLPIENWETEFSPEWANKSLRFDNYFEYQGKAYALEMDGEFHYKDNTLANESLQLQQERDLRKDILAKEHSIEVIRINCNSLSYDVLNEKIFNSRLNEVFDLKSLDLNYCWRKASSNLLKEVCDFYTMHKDMTNKEIAKHFHISAWTVAEYLKRGGKCGLCDYSVEIARKNSITKSARSRRKSDKKAFDAYDPNGKHIGEFKTIVECVDYLNSLNTGHVFSEQNICAVLINYRKSLWKYKFIRKEQIA